GAGSTPYVTPSVAVQQGSASMAPTGGPIAIPPRREGRKVMNKSLLIGLVVGAGATAGMGALASLTLKGGREAPQPILATQQLADQTVPSISGDAQLAIQSEESDR